MKIIAVDDEALALEGLLAAIRKAHPGAVTRAFSDAEAALTYARKTPPDVAFLDIELRSTSGIWLAEMLQELNPNVNIIFTTGYRDYAAQALALHVSGYILKPITPEKVRRELDALRYPVLEFREPETSAAALTVHAFGNFEAFVDGIPVQFLYAKTKELLAYLVDRNGALCSNQEILATLWEDDQPGKHISYLKSIRSDLLSTLSRHGCADVLVRVRGGIGILPDKINCDYYDYLRSDVGDGAQTPRQAYRGEYMTQYSWAEVTNSSLLQMQQNG